jgi:hypothetical protein
VKRVEDILTGQRSFIELDAGLEKHARVVAEKIFKKQTREICEEAEIDYQSVDINSLESQTHRSTGREYVCHSIWNALRLKEFFTTQGISTNVLPLMEVLVIGRLVDPDSELYTKQRVEKRSAFLSCQVVFLVNYGTPTIVFR